MRNDPAAAARLGRVARDYYVLGDNRTITDRKPEVVWLYGPTGTGKTNMARKYFEYLQRTGDSEITNYIRTPGPIKWWDGYEGDIYTVIDDFRRNQLRDVGGFAYLLRLLDRYPVRVEIKGGSVPFVAHYIIITCPRHPEDEFTYRGIGGDADRIEEDVAQLIRRLDRIVRVGTPADPTQVLDVSRDVWAKYGLGEPPGNIRFDEFLHGLHTECERLGEGLDRMDG